LINLFKAKNILYLAFEKADKSIICGKKVKEADNTLNKEEFYDFMQIKAMQNMYFNMADKD